MRRGEPSLRCPGFSRAGAACGWRGGAAEAFITVPTRPTSVRSSGGSGGSGGPGGTVSGRRSVKVEPSPMPSLYARSSPSIATDSAAHFARPPRLNTVGKASAAMPWPSSETDRHSAPASTRAASTTAPVPFAGECLRALLKSSLSTATTRGESSTTRGGTPCPTERSRRAPPAITLLCMWRASSSAGASTLQRTSAGCSASIGSSPPVSSTSATLSCRCVRRAAMSSSAMRDGAASASASACAASATACSGAATSSLTRRANCHRSVSTSRALASRAPRRRSRSRAAESSAPWPAPSSAVALRSSRRHTTWRARRRSSACCAADSCASVCESSTLSAPMTTLDEESSGTPA